MSTKACPQCAEEIKDAAILCKWCKADLRPAAPSALPAEQDLPKAGQVDPIGQLPEKTQQIIAVALGMVIVVCSMLVLAHLMR